MNLSKRAINLPASPIRKLVPYADQAKNQGVKIYHLNIGQPDIESPKRYLKALKNLNQKTIAYEHSMGNLKLRQNLVNYYANQKISLNPEEIIITTGASEALLFALIAVADANDEVLVIEPFYANYAGFAGMADIKLKAITTQAENGFHLPQLKEIEKLITKKTKAIIICNPNNPTGTVYSLTELKMVDQLAKRHGLFIISDETYREFVYGKTKHFSLMNLSKSNNKVIMVDSFSKLYSLCGARLGCLVSANKKVMESVLKMAQARLAASTTAQAAAIEVLKNKNKYLVAVKKEYQLRRNEVMKTLSGMTGIVIKKPEGAFYATVKLPIDNAEKFAKWLLTDFRYKNETVMVAPAEGFYLTPGLGKDEIRIAYVLERSKIKQAMKVLLKALKEYNQLRKNNY